MKPTTKSLKEQLSRELNAIAELSEDQDITGYFLCTTFKNPQTGLNTGSFSVWDSSDIVNLIGMLCILSNDLQRSTTLTQTMMTQRDSQVLDKLDRLTKKKSDRLQ